MIPRPADALTRVHDWLRASPTGLIVLAVVVGIGGGIGAIVFRWLIQTFTLVFSGHADYSAAAGEPNPYVPFLGVAFLVVVPSIGGWLYGPLIARFAPEARGHGVPEVMLAVAERGGRIPMQVAVVKSLGSALCIGSGGSVGREGPIVQIGSALGSSLGQLVRVSESRMRLLVACGAAAGISATFNAPIAGVFFALELILRDFEAGSFGVVVLASVLAGAIGRAAFGGAPFLQLPPFELVSYGEYALYALLGLLAAFVGIAFVRVLYGLEDVADRLWRGKPEWARPGILGLSLGVLLLLVPQMYGVGYPVLEGAIKGQYLIGVLLLFLVAKMVATSLTIAIGGSGGVFAPSLFIGATLGSAFGQLVQGPFAGAVAPAGAYGLVGMGAVFAAAARAPITAVLIIFELTNDYTIILPLMFAIVLASGVSTRLSRDTIYTLKLRRRGIDILRGRAANLMQLIRVGDAMTATPQPLDAEQPLDAILTRFGDEARDALPVVDERGAFRGVVTADEVERAMRENALDATAGSLAKREVQLRESQSLEDAVRILTATEGTGAPVLGASGDAVVGWITHRDVLQAYRRTLERSVRERPTAPRPAAAGVSAPRALAELRQHRIVELELRSVAPDRAVKDIPWPTGSLLMAIRRGGETFVPTGMTVLRKGDRLTVLAPASEAERLADIVAGDGRPGR